MSKWGSIVGPVLPTADTPSSLYENIKNACNQLYGGNIWKIGIPASRAVAEREAPFLTVVDLDGRVFIADKKGHLTSVPYKRWETVLGEFVCFQVGEQSLWYAEIPETCRGDVDLIRDYIKEVITFIKRVERIAPEGLIAFANRIGAGIGLGAIPQGVVLPLDYSRDPFDWVDGLFTRGKTEDIGEGYLYQSLRTLKERLNQVRINRTSQQR